MKKSSESVREKFFAMPGIILTIVLFAMAVLFFYLLDKSRSTGFGFVEIILALVFALLMGGFFIWCKTVMYRNPYLGAGIAIFGVIALDYGFKLRYTGGTSNYFLIVGIILTLVYIGYNFFKYRDSEKPIPNEFDES
jgi:cytochrome bd-type quinol oxidase subunit 2